MNVEMINWITDDLVPNDKIFVIPDNLRVHTIYCIEDYYDPDTETRGITLKSKNYYYSIKNGIVSHKNKNKDP
jgi:hypothetical protein